MLLSRTNTLDTVDDHQARGVGDDIWVRKFGEAGGEAIIGSDARMLTRPHELIAIVESGLRLIVLPSQWVNAKIHLQIAFLAFWWPEIEEVLNTSKPGQCFKVPWSWGETKGAIKFLPIDVQAAYKKVKKADKKS
jgi:hypothetical protein